MSETVPRLAIIAALYTIIAAIAIGPVIDPDIWWHLSACQWITAHGTVPTTDPFSVYGMDKPWIAYSWLFEVLVYFLYSRFGLSGILFYRIVLTLGVTAAFHLLIAKREPRFT